MAAIQWRALILGVLVSGLGISGAFDRSMHHQRYQNGWSLLVPRAQGNPGASLNAWVLVKSLGSLMSFEHGAAVDLLSDCDRSSFGSFEAIDHPWQHQHHQDC
jgi:hypothetical protein